MDEEYEMAEGKSSGGSPIYKPKPFQIIVENTTDQPKTAVIFGNNRFLLSNRFGNPNGIQISVGQPGVEYLELLQQSANQPFYASLIRIQSENTTQITKFITINYKHANGRLYRDPVDMQTHKSAYQQQDNIIDGVLNTKIDGNTYLETEIEPNTRVFYTIFPTDEVDTSRTLVGHKPIKNFDVPQVNMAGYAIKPHTISERKMLK